MAMTFNSISDLLAAFTTAADPSLTSVLAKGSSDGSAAVAIPFKVFCAYLGKAFAINESGKLTYYDTDGNKVEVDLRLRWDNMTAEQQAAVAELVRASCVEEIEETKQLNEDFSAAEADRVAAETQRAAAETAREANESERKTNETERQSAESDRQAAEDAREANEATRKANELERQANEAERVANEQTRQAQEAERQADTATAITNSEEQTAACKTATDLAEEMNAHPDYIGDDGYWYKWNVETEVYENTGKLGAGGIVYPTFDMDDDEMDITMSFDDDVSEDMFGFDEEEGELYFGSTADTTDEDSE